MVTATVQAIDRAGGAHRSKWLFQVSGLGDKRIVYLGIRARESPMLLRGLSCVRLRSVGPEQVRSGVRGDDGAENTRTTARIVRPFLRFRGTPARIVEGVVREAGSGKPVPGVRIHGSAGYGFESEAISDQEGRYRLEGLPKVKHYHLLHAMPPWDSPWLPASQNKEADEGMQPVRLDFTLSRGVFLTGRAIDRASEKGVKSSITFVPLPDNKYAGKLGYELYHGGWDTDADGRFRIKVIPGTGVLEAHASGAINRYKLAQFDVEDRKHVTLTANGDFIAYGGQSGFLSLFNAAKRLDLPADAGAVEQDIYLEPGATAKVRIEDPQGKPLVGALVSGIDALPGQHYRSHYVAPESECTILALDPSQPRQVIFYHAQRRLAGSLLVRGDEKQPLTVRLSPTGTVIGRVLDAEGEPLRDIEIEVWANSPSASASLRYLYLSVNQSRLAVRTDSVGRFRLDGVVSDEKFSVSIRRRGAYLANDLGNKQLQVKAGETLDLGDIHIKPME